MHATLPAHTVNYRHDMFMAYGDWFKVNFSGPGGQGHARGPAILDAAARFVVAPQALTEELAGEQHVVATVTELRSATAST